MSIPYVLNEVYEKAATAMHILLLKTFQVEAVYCEPF
jgi:hypothetical protein